MSHLHNIEASIRILGSGRSPHPKRSAVGWISSPYAVPSFAPGHEFFCFANFTVRSYDLVSPPSVPLFLLKHL